MNAEGEEDVKAKHREQENEGEEKDGQNYLEEKVSWRERVAGQEALRKKQIKREKI